MNLPTDAHRYMSAHEKAHIPLPVPSPMEADHFSRYVNQVSTFLSFSFFSVSSIIFSSFLFLLSSFLFLLFLSSFFFHLPSFSLTFLHLSTFFFLSSFFFLLFSLFLLLSFFFYFYLPVSLFYSSVCSNNSYFILFSGVRLSGIQQHQVSASNFE